MVVSSREKDRVFKESNTWILSESKDTRKLHYNEVVLHQTLIE